VYILKSKKDDKLYIGYTEDLRKRIKEHNLGFVPSTKLRKPFKLVYYESYLNQQDATRREHNLKLRAKALRQLKDRIQSSLGA
jgi:putative endonuclease